MAENFVARLDDREWRLFFNGLLRETKDKPRLLKSAYSVFGFKDIIEHFKDEQGPDGKWQKRSESTNRRYESIGSGRSKLPKGFRRGTFSKSNKILQLTGKTRQSILTKTTKKRGTNKVEVLAGTNYSGKHDRGEGRFPQRKFMWLSDTALERMAQFIVETIFRRASRGT